jgi:hypothetical protein
MQVSASLRKALRSPAAILTALGIVASTTAQADLVGYRYTDTSGNLAHTSPDWPYLNPRSGITLYVASGIDRQVHVEVKNAQGQTVFNRTSAILGAADRFDYEGRSFYGFQTTTDKLPDGRYTVRARVLNSAGEVVRVDDQELTLDTAPPQVGDFSWSMVYGGGTAPDGKPIWSRTNARHITLSGLSDPGTGIHAVTYRSLFADGGKSGQVFRSGNMDYFPDEAKAMLGNGGENTGAQLAIPAERGMQRFEVTVSDKAGNATSTELTFYNNSICGPAPELYAVEAAGHTSLGISGFRTVLGQSSVHVTQNPLRTIYRVPRAEHRDMPEGAIYGGRPASITNHGIVHTDANYAYFMIQGPLGLDGTFNWNASGWTNSSTYRCAPFSVANPSFSEMATPPRWVSLEARIDGVGWVGNTYGNPSENVNPPRDTRISALRATVQPRAYAQTFTYLGGTCEVPAGGTQCVANVNTPFNTTGTANRIHDRPPMRAKHNTALFSQFNSTVWEWDADDPTITRLLSHDPTRRLVRFEGVERFSGNTWNRVRMHSAGLVIRNNSGFEQIVPASEMSTTGDVSTITATYHNLPEGAYRVYGWVRDNYRNYGEMYFFDVANDTTPPSIEISAEGQSSVSSLDEITVALADNMSAAPVVTSVRLAGGPSSELVYLTLRPIGNNQYKLEYPVMFPTLEAGEEYTLTVVARDDFYNEASQAFTFAYEPRIVSVLGDEGDGLKIPAVNYAFSRPDGLHAVATESLTLSDGAVVAGIYDVFATLRSDSEMALIINGVRVEPGATMTVLPSHDFSAHQGKINIPISVADYQAAGRAMLLLSTTAPNAPIVLANIDAWTPELTLSADTWSVYPALEEVIITPTNQAGHCQAITSDPFVARTSGHPITHPVCLVEWQTYPRELYESEVDGEPLLTGYVANIGLSTVRAHVSLVTPGGHKVRLETIEGELEIKLPDGSIKTRLNPNVPTVERLVESIFFTIEQTEGPKCSIITTNEDLAIDIAGRRSPSCLLTWEEIPPGLDEDDLRRNTPSLQGTIEYTEGDKATIAWTIDAFTPAGTKVPMGRYTKTLDVVDPPLPTFEINSRLHLDGDLYAISREGGYLGDYTVEGRPVAIWTREMINGDLAAEEESLGFFSRANRITRRMIMEDAPLWSYTDVELEAFYSRLPEMVSSHALRVLAVPSDNLRPVIHLDETTVLNTSEMVVEVALQDPYAPQQPYNPDTMGHWEVRLMNYMSLSNQMPLTEFQPLGVDGTTTFQVDPKQVDATGFRLVAQARVVSPEPLYERQVLSPRPLYVTVLRGEAIGAEVTGRRFSGPAPLTFIGMLQLDNRLDQGAMGQVIWELREAGQADWQTVEDTGFVKGRIMKTFQAGKYELRARIPNVNSGAEYITEAVEIHAFDVPSVDLKGPWNVFIGDTGRYRVEATLNGIAVPEDQMEVLWSLDDGATWMAGEATMEISRDTFERVTLRARTRLIDSDAEVDDAWVERRGRISFRPVLPPRAGIVGPRVIEMGTEHEWRSVLRPPFRHMEVHQNGYFVLPDGTRVDGEVLRYTPTEADLQNGFVTIGFVSWIDGFPETHNEISQRIRVWIYEWPRWDFYSRLTAMEAPASLSIRVRSPGSRARYIEGLSYEWHLPEGAVVEQARSGDSRVLSFAQAGSYPITVDIRDDRGHHSRITETIVLDEQTPWEADYRLNYSNAAMREPLTVGFRPMVSGGHPRDRVTTFRYLLNGEVVASDIRYGSVQVPVGEHEIAMQFDTEFGHTVEKREMLSVAPNQPLVCGLDVRTLDSSWRFYAECRDPDGTVVGHRWLINGEPVGVSGSRISITRRDDQKPSVTLYGIDDAGALSAPVNW